MEESQDSCSTREKNRRGRRQSPSAVQLLFGICVNTRKATSNFYRFHIALPFFPCLFCYFLPSFLLLFDPSSEGGFCFKEEEKDEEEEIASFPSSAPQKFVRQVNSRNVRALYPLPFIPRLISSLPFRLSSSFTHLFRSFLARHKKLFDPSLFRISTFFSSLSSSTSSTPSSVLSSSVFFFFLGSINPHQD